MRARRVAWIGVGVAVIAVACAGGYAARRATESPSHIDELQAKIDEQGRTVEHLQTEISRLGQALDTTTIATTAASTTTTVAATTTTAAPEPLSISTGIYQVGVDIPRGQYRTTSPDDGAGSPNRCYWSKLKTPDYFNQTPIDHGYGGPVTVNVDSPYFRVDGCLFVRVG